MADDRLKIVIPMAGLGTRLRPHTWSKPKQLIGLAGKTVLDHVLDMLNTLPDPRNIEFIHIIGYLGDQIETHVLQNYPEIPAHFVVQDNPAGQSHAIYLAREFLQEGPMLMIFADTLMEADLSFLNHEKADAVAWVKPVPDPRRFGVAEVGADGWVTRLIEKPQDMNNNLAVIGCYYFKHAADLISAIEEQMRRNLQIKGEFFLADAINILIERGAKMRVQEVDVWLDAGTSEALLESNHYLLDHGRANYSTPQILDDVVLIPPVFIHPEAEIHHSVIGPYVSIGCGCKIETTIMRNSILEEGAKVNDLVIEDSLVGRKTEIIGRPRIINAGDNTDLTL
jgi:glucose-1-phosphate thymidylyltransferase